MAKKKNSGETAKTAAPGVVGLYDESKEIARRLLSKHRRGDAEIVAYLALSTIQATNIISFVKEADE